MKKRKDDNMKVQLGVSNRHIHLSLDDYKILFGDIEIENIKDLVQPGEFATNLVVEIATEKAKISKVRFLGPIRPYTQVEVSKTDCYTLGIDAPVRGSGDLTGAAEVTIIGPCGTITKKCAIIANRHLHLNHENRIKLGLDGIDKISVKVGTEKSAILNDVYVKETLNGALELHLDTDDANANLLKTGDIVEIIL
jgi:propanediol utilization protein